MLQSYVNRVNGAKCDPRKICDVYPCISTQIKVMLIGLSFVFPVGFLLQHRGLCVH